MVKQAEWISGVAFTDERTGADAGGPERGRRTGSPRSAGSTSTTPSRPRSPSRRSRRRRGKGAARTPPAMPSRASRRRGRPRTTSSPSRPSSDLGRLLRAKKVSSTELTKLCLARLREVRPGPLVRGHGDGGARPRAGEAGRRGARRGEGPRAAPRDPLGRQGPDRRPRLPDDVGLGAVQGPDAPGDRDRLPEARGGGRRPRRQDRGRRAGVGRRLVRRDDEEPVEARPGLERLIGRLGLGDRRRSRRLRARDGDAGEHRLSLHALRRHGPPADVRPRQPARGDGSRLDDGQGRRDRPVGRGTAPSSSRRSRGRTRSTRTPPTARSPGRRAGA